MRLLFIIALMLCRFLCSGRIRCYYLSTPGNWQEHYVGIDTRMLVEQRAEPRFGGKWEDGDSL